MNLILLAELWGRQYPCRNPASGSEEWVNDLVSPLMFAEKSSLMCDVSEPSLQASDEVKSGRQAIANMPSGEYASMYGKSMDSQELEMTKIMIQ